MGWPNYVLIYDGHGKLLRSWFVGDAISAGRKGGAGGARETAYITRVTSRSLDVVVNNIATGQQGECCGTGRDVFRLSKNSKGKPVFTLITRRN